MITRVIGLYNWGLIFLSQHSANESFHGKTEYAEDAKRNVLIVWVFQDLKILVISFCCLGLCLLEWRVQCDLSLGFPRLLGWPFWQYLNFYFSWKGGLFHSPHAKNGTTAFSLPTSLLRVWKPGTDNLYALVSFKMLLPLRKSGFLTSTSFHRNVNFQLLKGGVSSGVNDL